MKCIINGISDNDFKKFHMDLKYISEFKQKLKIYGKIGTDCENMKPYEFNPDMLVKEKPSYLKLTFAIPTIVIPAIRAASVERNTKVLIALIVHSVQCRRP